MNSAALRFEKYEGAGNDFLIVKADRVSDVSPAEALQLCNRHFGVGGDGVLLVLPATDTVHAGRMHVINADGSIAEMCGNGLRCVALYLAKGEFNSSVLAIETGAGLRECLVEKESTRGAVDVAMGRVRVGATRTLRIEGQDLTLTLADAGNPHAIVWGKRSRAEIAQLGPALATHPEFSHGINVNFAHIGAGAEGEPFIELVVWERGSGLTLACGTGACATASAAWAAGLVATKSTRVRLPGGTLEITPDTDSTVRMKGPARRVFGGSWNRGAAR